MRHAREPNYVRVAPHPDALSKYPPATGREARQPVQLPQRADVPEIGSSSRFKKIAGELKGGLELVGTIPVPAEQRPQT